MNLLLSLFACKPNQTETPAQEETLKSQQDSAEPTFCTSSTGTCLDTRKYPTSEEVEAARTKAEAKAEALREANEKMNKHINGAAR